MLASIVVEKQTDIDCGALEDQEWLPYNFTEEKIVMLPSKLFSVRHSVHVAKARERGYTEAMSSCRKGLTHQDISIDYVRLVWRQYLAVATDIQIFLILEKQNAFNKLSGLIVSV